jgi:D-aspartate ligase
VAAFAGATVFPVVMKRVVNRLPEHRTQESVVIVEGPEELLEAYEKIEVPGEPNVMLQEYIPGGPESVWMFNGYFAYHSERLAGFTGKKIRQAPPFTGATTLGICLENETVEKTTMDFMRRIGYRGIVDMGYRYDHRDGRYKLLDVNPRVGSTFRLFVDSNGMDVVRALYLDLTGQPVQPGVPREGRKWVVEQSDLMSSLEYCRLGRLTPMQWVRSLQGLEEGAWFAKDDPVPFAAMGWASLLKATRGAKDRIIRAVRDPQ